MSGLELAPSRLLHGGASVRRVFTYVRNPGQVLQYDLDHLNDEFNCYISSFFPPLLPITALQSAFPSALIRGFGFQPACISWPKGFAKTRHRFQSNEEM